MLPKNFKLMFPKNEDLKRREKKLSKDGQAYYLYDWPVRGCTNKSVVKFYNLKLLS
jgi:hypothetical protein